MSNIPCSVIGCTRSVKARGLCRRHYEEWRLANRADVLPYNPRPATCTAEDCQAPVIARALCEMHYARWRRLGTTEVSRPNPHGTAEERFWRQIDTQGPRGCWLWTGATKNHNGYGALTLRGTPRSVILAHRFAYELLVGPIPDGLQLDHLCRVRHCVNPDHLEPVTQAENVRRGISPSAVQARKTHCKNGHEFTPENTYVNRNRNERVCRLCMNRAQREYQQRKRAGYGPKRALSSFP